MSEDNNRMLTKKDLNKIFLRSYCYECSYNYVRQQHMGFIWSMAPALKKIYKDDLCLISFKPTTDSIII